MPRGHSKEVMAEMNIKAQEVKKEKSIITAYERNKIKEEKIRLRTEKVQMIKKENEKLAQQQEEPKEEEEEEPPQEEVKKEKKEKKKRIVEVIEEIEEEESSSEEEEVIIRRIIKKIPKKRVEQNDDKLYELNNQDLLKRKLYENTKKRLMNDLFS